MSYNNAPPGTDRHGNWMQTFTGKMFWPLDPRAEEVDIVDIAHSLSMQCRYGGHCDIFYTVAEHSWHVSQIVGLPGLLHDATEAYCQDIIRPVKYQLTGYTQIEQRIEYAVAEHFGLKPGFAELAEVKAADNAVLLAEAEQIMKPHPAPWAIPGEPADIVVRGWEPARAKGMFLARFRKLTSERGSIPHSYRGEGKNYVD